MQFSDNRKAAGILRLLIRMRSPALDFYGNQSTAVAMPNVATVSIKELLINPGIL